MRLAVGIDDCGSGFAVDVSTFEKLKIYCLSCVKDENTHGFYDELVKRLEVAQTEEDLMSNENMDLFCDMECSPFQGRDNFTELEDPLTWSK